MADVEQMKKIVPFVTCEITFGQNVCELLLGINVSNSNLRIKISPVKQPIQSNSVGSWHMSRCGLRPLTSILITASLSSKTYNTALEPECVPLGGKWSVLVRSRLVFVVGVCFRMFVWGVADRFLRGSLTSWFCWFGLVRNEMLQSLKPKDRERESHLCVNLHREKLPQLLQKLCETEVCFLHIQLIGTNVWLPEIHRIPPDADFESSSSPANSESSNNPNLHCLAVLPT